MHVFYTIGDVHGEKLLLERLLVDIETHFTDLKVANPTATGTVVFLGDYVDRGPDSKGVINTVVGFIHEQPLGMTAIALKGNHEQMLVDTVWGIKVRSIPREQEWMYFSNQHKETVRSYGDSVHDIPVAHLEWMDRLPTIVQDDEHKLIFVHAGVHVENYPDCSDDVYIWSRYPQFFRSEWWPYNPHLEGFTVVHGHTPPRDLQPTADARRINCDSGAVFGGSLTAAVIVDGKFERFLSIKNDNPTFGW